MRLLELNELVRLIPWQEMSELLSTIRAPYAGLYSNSYLTQEFHRVALNASREFSLRRTNELSCNNIESWRCQSAYDYIESIRFWIRFR